MTDIIETISGIVDSASGDGKGGEKPSETKDKPGFLDKFKNAFAKAAEAKDKGMFDRAKIFVTSLLKDLFGLGEEQKEVTMKTEAEVTEAVEAEMAAVRGKMKLDKAVSADDKATFDEVLAMGVASKASLDSEHGGLADSAMAKLQAAVDGKSAEKLTFSEVTTMSAMGLMTLAQLKDKFPDPAVFIKAVKRLQEVSGKSSLPLAKLLSADVLGLFQIDLDKNEMAIGRVMAKFGMGILGMGEFGPDDVKGAFKNLKAQPFAKKGETVAFFHKHIFTNTSEPNVGKALVKINEMIGDSEKKLNIENLAELVFLIDSRDFTKLVTALVGPDNYLARKTVVN